MGGPILGRPLAEQSRAREVFIRSRAAEEAVDGVGWTGEESAVMQRCNGDASWWRDWPAGSHFSTTVFSCFFLQILKILPFVLGRASRKARWCSVAGASQERPRAGRGPRHVPGLGLWFGPAAGENHLDAAFSTLPMLPTHTPITSQRAPVSGVRIAGRLHRRHRLLPPSVG